ncbi:MAG: hypothetical protein AAGH64_06015, partial [Planctomycetota bacterium]
MCTTHVLALLLTLAPLAAAQHEHPWFARPDADIPAIIEAMTPGELVLVHRGDHTIGPHTYRLTPDATSELTIDVAHALHTLRNGESFVYDAIPDVRLRTETKCLARRDDGAYEIRTRIRSAEPAHFAMGTVQGFQDIRAVCAFMKGSTLLATLTPTGERVRTRWAPVAPSSRALTDVRQAVLKHCTPPRLPEEPFGVNAVWRTLERIPSATGNSYNLSTVSLDAIDDNTLTLTVEQRTWVPAADLGEHPEIPGSSYARDDAVSYFTTSATVDRATGATLQGTHDGYLALESAVTHDDIDPINLTVELTASHGCDQASPLSLTRDEADRLLATTTPGQLTLIDPGADPEPRACTPSVGDTLSLAFTTVEDGIQLLPDNRLNPAAQVDLPRTVLVTRTVTRTLPNGVFTVHETIDAITVHPRHEDEHALARASTEDLQERVGLSVTSTYAPDLELIDHSVETIDNPSPTVADFYASIAEPSAGDLFRIPHQPFGVGAIWTIRTADPSEGIQRELIETYRVDAIEGDTLRVNFVSVIARLWACGVTADWSQIWGSARRNRLRLPGYAFQRSRYFIEPDRQTAKVEAPRLSRLEEIA